MGHFYFGAQVGAKRHQIECMWPQKPKKTATKTKQKNAFVPGGFGKVEDGWKRLEMERGTAALKPLFKGKVIVGWLHRGHFSGS